MFLNLIMLAGLGGMSVPLVLHLLARARYRSVDWGAMMFLRGTDLRQRQSARLKQWLLLALRMAIVGLLAIALARPLLNARFTGGQDASTAAVLIIDHSFSMSLDDAGRPRLDKAKELARQVLRLALRRGDQACVLPAGGNDPAPANLSSNLAAVDRDLDNLKLSHGAADMPAALQHALDLLEQTHAANRDIYIVCDTQAASWRTASDGFLGAWTGKNNSLKPPVRVTVLPIGGEDADNIAVESVELDTAPAIKGQPCHVEVRVHNFGDIAHAAVPVTISITSASGGTRTIDAMANVAAHDTDIVRCPFTFSEAGSHVLSAEVQGPGLADDKRLATAVDVLDPLRILIISGDERDEPFRSESDFLRLALAPFRTSKIGRGVDPAGEVTVVPFEAWAAAPAELHSFNVVILANVPWFTDAQVRALEQYVYSGGGLLIAPGNLANIDHYNTALYRDGAGLLPAKLKPAVAADGSQATTILGLEMRHPIFRFLKDQSERLPSATIGRYFPDELLQTGARRLGTYASGSSFLIELPLERGRVLLLTTALDADWTTLPLSNFYLPFIQSIAQYLAGASRISRDLAPGDALVLSSDAPIDPRSILLRLPNNVTATVESVSSTGREIVLRTGTNDRFTAELSSTGSGSILRFFDTQRAGVYALSYKLRPAPAQPPDPAMHTVHYVVQTPRDESDLTPLSARQWKRLQDGLGLTRVDPAAGNIAAAFSRSRGGRELWLPLVGAIMVLSLVELWVARRISRRQP